MNDLAWTVTALALLCCAALGWRTWRLQAALAAKQAQLDQVSENQGQLRKTESMLREMSDNLPGVVYEYLSLPDGGVVFNFISQHVQALWGIDREQVMQAPGILKTLVVPSQRERVTCYIAGAQRNAMPWSIEFQIQRADGSVRWIKGAAQPLKSFNPQMRQNNEPLTWSGYWVDITEAKTLEEAVADAKSQAEAASQAKSDFLANMSHEIRTPMNAILGMSHLLQLTPLDLKQGNYARKIQQACRHLLGILNDVLDVSKIESGKLQIEAIDMDLNAVLDNVNALVAEKAVAKGLALTFQVDPDVPTRLQGDPLRLGQVLVNLANNAVKFTERGHIDVRIQALAQSDHDIMLKLSVADTGIGLSAEQLEGLFQSFHQADVSVTRKYGGTGLGLAICKSLASLMGGEVGVDSVLGQGSVFWFTAKLLKNDGQDQAANAHANLRGKRLLVVDDNGPARLQLWKLLQSFSFEVKTSATGAEALNAIQVADLNGQPFDAVLLDWVMPGMTGIEVAQRIAELPLGKPPKRLFVTGHGREEVILAARNAGIDDVLVKPVNPSILFDTLVRLLNERVEVRPVNTLMTPDHDNPGLKPLRGQRVLLVEDNAMNQEVARDLLTAVGMSVDVAEHGGIALEKISANAYDVVLMDMQMPVMDGITATVAIRQLPGHEQLPIIAMTANVLATDKEKCFQAGMVDFIGKPIDPQVLWETLLKWVRPEAQAGETPLFSGRAAIAGAATSVSSLPWQLPGLDTRRGMLRVLGDRTRYERVLGMFIEEQHDAIDRARAGWQADQAHDAQRVIHTLKGSSDTIGATALREKVEQLERVLKTDHSGEGHAHQAQAEPPWALVEEPLKALISQLRAVLPASVEASTAAMDPVAVRAMLPTLMRLLKENDSEAFELFQAHQAELKQMYPDAFETMSSHVLNFDFAAALNAFELALKAARSGHNEEQH